jgi:hypothetical protein
MAVMVPPWQEMRSVRVGGLEPPAMPQKDCSVAAAAVAAADAVDADAADAAAAAARDEAAAAAEAAGGAAGFCGGGATAAGVESAVSVWAGWRFMVAAVWMRLFNDGICSAARGAGNWDARAAAEGSCAKPFVAVGACCWGGGARACATAATAAGRS